MSYIMLFHPGRGYYSGNIRILLKYPRSVDIIRISWKYHLLSVFQAYILASRVYLVKSLVNFLSLFKSSILSIFQSHILDS